MLKRFYCTDWPHDRYLTSGVVYGESADQLSPYLEENLNIEEVNHPDGRWSLELGNESWVSDNFEELEKLLLTWARDEGYDVPSDGCGEPLNPGIINLAEAALPINDDDLGSERQVQAENAFWDAVQPWVQSDDPCFAHATTEEAINYALEQVLHQEARSFMETHSKPDWGKLSLDEWLARYGEKLSDDVRRTGRELLDKFDEL